MPTNAPVLAALTSLTLNVGQTLVITNRLISGTALGAFAFSFAAPAPPSASINPTNGILRWTPSCSDASRTYTLTMRVTDTGNTNIYDLASFTVRVANTWCPAWAASSCPQVPAGACR